MPKKVLIVEDDANIAELISLYLMKECFETMTVDNGEDAVKEFSSIPSLEQIFRTNVIAHVGHTRSHPGTHENRQKRFARFPRACGDGE